MTNHDYQRTPSNHFLENVFVIREMLKKAFPVGYTGLFSPLCCSCCLDKKVIFMYQLRATLNILRIDAIIKFNDIFFITHQSNHNTYRLSK